MGVQTKDNCGVLANTVQSTAVRLGLSVRSIWNLISSGELKTIRAAGRVLITERELSGFLAEREAEGRETARQ
jgi:hypothetical protein